MSVERRADALIRRWFTAALEAADPKAAVVRAVTCHGGALGCGAQSVPVSGGVFVVAVGKAAPAMARGAEAACGGLIRGGYLITKEGHLDAGIPAWCEAYEAAHPIPDARGTDATLGLLNRLATLGRGDVVLALISGGGSALLEAPREGVSLADVAATTDLLLRAGAPIHDLNAVRVPLSCVKGGGLRRAAPDVRWVTLLLSDVLGNDRRVIASGPTVAGSAGGAEALAVLERYGVAERTPAAVLGALLSDASHDDDDLFSDDIVEVIADNATAVASAAVAARQDGYAPRVIWEQAGGEAAELAERWVTECLAVGDDSDVLLGGGEATVTVRGAGLGGRNTEFALAAAIALHERGRFDWTVASLATDGQDGMTGAAGAVAEAATIGRCLDLGIDPRLALRDNDSLRVFERVGGLVETGPSGTNVNDLYVAVRAGAT